MAQHKTLKLSSLLVASAFSSLSYGSGFALTEQSVTGLGRAFAGSAAVAEDASTIFFNPAGLTQLKHTEADFGLNYIAPQSDFKDKGSSVPNYGGLGGFSGQPLTGGNGGDAANDAIVPNIYFSHPVNDKTVLGIGVNAPFGLVTDYNDNWKGRYHAVKSDLKTVNINPSIAFQATDKLSLGLGVNYQKIDLKLTQMADLGARAGFPQGEGLPFKTDGKVRMDADDWSWGYNLGATFQATEATRIGLSYRSKISHTLEGHSKLRDAQGTIIAAEKIKGDVDLPESASFAIHHQLNDKWAIMGDASWTRWSRFDELAIESNGPVLGSTKEEDWDDSMRYGLGLTYAHNDTWSFRAGVAFDETPIPDAQHTTPRIPGEDRTWVAFGASYKYSENLTLDAGYTHIFVDDPKIDDTDDNGYNLTGDVDASVDIVGVQMRWLFL